MAPSNPFASATQSLKDGGSLFQSACATLQRPTTAVMTKMLNKMILPGANNDGKFKAKDLQKLIDKFISRQKKARESHQALLKALCSWLADMPNESTTTLVNEFVQLMDGVECVYANHGETLNNLKVQLGSVATREARQYTLIRKHDELQRNHETAAVKHGFQSKLAALVIDQIEENEYNLKIIEQQLVRTTMTGFKDVSADYLNWFQTSLYMLGKRSNSLANTLREGEMQLVVPRSLVLDSGRTCFDEPLDSVKLASETLKQPETVPKASNEIQLMGLDDVSVLRFEETGTAAFSKPLLATDQKPSQLASQNNDQNTTNVNPYNKEWNYEDDVYKSSDTWY